MSHVKVNAFDVYMLSGDKWVSLDTHIQLKEECSYTEILKTLKENIEIERSSTYTISDDDGTELLVTSLDSSEKFKLIRNEALENDLYDR